MKMMAKSTRLEQADRTGRRRVGDDGRQRACGAADDDVLRRRALQPHRVDDGIEEDREGEQGGRQPVRHEAERRSRTRRRAAARSRAPRRAPTRPAGTGRERVRAHHGVDVGVVPHVQRARCACADSDREQRHGGDERVHRARRDQQSGQRREDHERHHPRLEQCEIVFGSARICRGNPPRLSCWLTKLIDHPAV